MASESGKLLLHNYKLTLATAAPVLLCATAFFCAYVLVCISPTSCEADQQKLGRYIYTSSYSSTVTTINYRSYDFSMTDEIIDEVDDRILGKRLYFVANNSSVYIS